MMAVLNLRCSAILTATVLLLLAPRAAEAQVQIDGFVQALFGGQTDSDNPTETEFTASETRFQLRAEHFGDDAEMFSRIDFVFDGVDSVEYDWELREAYIKFRLGSQFDFKVGRQIITWGTGDLLFINDNFAKDYRSFFIGRDDQYLKAPQNSVRAEYYSPLGDLSIVWSPRFEPNRFPRGERLSFFDPLSGIVGSDRFYEAILPAPKLENSELALRLNRQIGVTTASLYFYRGFYKNPLGTKLGVSTFLTPFFPRLNVYGASIRGVLGGGIFWIEGGYYDSRDDPNRSKGNIVNSSLTGLLGFERQVASNLTVNGQWQLRYVYDFDKFQLLERSITLINDEVRHLLTSRITKLLSDELVRISFFSFYSPTDRDLYIRFSSEYKYSDELTLTGGGNIFAGENINTEIGQYQKNDNIYMKLTYGF